MGTTSSKETSSRSSISNNITARSRLLLDQRTPYEYERSLDKRRAKQRMIAIFIGGILLLLICGGIVFYLFFYENILDSGSDTDNEWTIDNITLAPGFKIEEYVKNTDENNFFNPRELHTSQYNGATIVYVGSIRWYYSLTSPAYIYALVDRNSDGINDDIYLIWENINSQNTASITIDDNNDKQWLFVDDRAGTIWKCENVHQQVLQMTSINDRLIGCYSFLNELPVAQSSSHDLHYLKIHPITQHLCIAFGVDGNIDIPNEPEGTIRCMNNDNPSSWDDSIVYVDGMRNSVGFDFHPLTNNLWFTDNAVIGMNDDDEDQPDDELNKVINAEIHMHFGFPMCHSGGIGPPILREAGTTLNIVDPDYGYLVNNTCNPDIYIPAIQPLGPQVGAMGIKFSFNNNFEPPQFKQMLLIAQHGSVMRSQKIGFRVMAVFLVGENQDTINGYGILADGWLDIPNQIEYGTPSDIELLPDGSILVSDDLASVIYRIYYDPDS